MQYATAAAGVSFSVVLCLIFRPAVVTSAGMNHR